ncbi:hypothetical protein [Alteribacillus bidgolensis]|uniref:Uncharacterized protein n=1 Tax=Alteribacillus bidgolensis TaxID=930129 RepID=A0A1G8H8V1_9BACI|nr:hypothetical protein [Alteribacillus bidgolensis]SDI03072.1 hypothetical protein SAMN05216352_104158 [Alteribacillus bidgolensis]
MKYTAHIQKADREDIEYIIRYIGEEPAPKVVNYEMDDITVHGAPLNDEEFLEHSGSGCSGCAVTNEDDEIEASIHWNGETESFKLENEQ